MPRFSGATAASRSATARRASTATRKTASATEARVHSAVQRPARKADKEARIEMRVDPGLKTIIEHAAALLGQSVSAFIISHAVSNARQVIDEHARTQASLADWARFQKILAKPLKPNAVLKRAVKRYRESVADSDGI
jgi:uncharacterized protein (DUF1778 family)